MGYCDFSAWENFFTSSTKVHLDSNWTDENMTLDRDACKQVNKVILIYTVLQTPQKSS